MGGIPAKLSVSALLFDYVLTGPISGVSAGQYLIGLSNELLHHFRARFVIPQGWGSAAIAAAITVYFWRANVRGLRESTDKALKIMAATTVMGVIMIAWCGVTLAVRPADRHLPAAAPDLSKKVDAEGNPKINEVTGHQEDPLGWLGNTSVGATLHDPSKVEWLSVVGALGVLIAFGHSVLAMSGEETLAQVYREVESPKLANFKKAAFVVFIYSLVLTALISFFAVMIIPDGPRTGEFKDNLIGGLAMSVVGPRWARLALHALVVGVGFLILSGAANTAIVGSNSVLGRVAEDGVLPEWFLKPHPEYGTSSRTLNLILGLQLFTIAVSHGDVILLGEAYAFGVVWSFVFMTLAMLVLRFRRPGDRPFMVPGNIKVGNVRVPVGLALIFLALIAAATANLFTKQVATVTGGIFAVVLFAILVGSERYLKSKGEDPEKTGQRPDEFEVEEADEFSPEALKLTKPGRTLIGIRSEHSLEALKLYLGEIDPEKTDVVVVIADLVPHRASTPMPGLSHGDQKLLSAVVKVAEEVGKPVIPIVVPTEDPFEALARIARSIGAGEVIMGPSRRHGGGDRQFERIARSWEFERKDGETKPLTVRILGEGRDDRRTLGAGN